MKFLFVHNNFPAQFRHLSVRLAADPGNEVRAIGSTTARALPGVALARYALNPVNVAGAHPFARAFEVESHRAEQTLYVATTLAANGFHPDVIVVHSGWGEALPLRAVFPTARIIVYCEFYYRTHSSDVNFDPEFPELGIDGLVSLHARNAMGLIALAESDLAISPTEWQKSTYPKEFADKILVAHEGIDCTVVAPRPDATFELPNGRVLSRGDEVVTYVARNLEPIRGYHVFMRALPQVLRERPNAQVIVVGGFEVSYGHRPPAGETWQKIFLDEVAGEVDTSRIHFVGALAYESYLDVLAISTVHAYLTYPFVLSWSCLEAMAMECVVVASDTQPVREVIDADTGILVPFHAVDRLAGSLIEVLADRDRFAHLGRRARERILERYELESICLPHLIDIVAPGATV